MTITSPALLSLDQLKNRLQERIDTLRDRIRVAENTPANPYRAIHDLKHDLRLTERRLKLLNDKVLLGRTATE